MASPASAPSTQRAQLIENEVTRRLGHEWDEWNGRPLPRGGDFSAAPGVFFRFAALTVVVATAVVALLLYLVGPRLVTLWSPLTRVLWIALAVLAGASALYLGLVASSYYGGRHLPPQRLLQRRPHLQLMDFTSLLARAVWQPGYLEHA